MEMNGCVGMKRAASCLLYTSAPAKPGVYSIVGVKAGFKSANKIVRFPPSRAQPVSYTHLDWTSAHSTREIVAAIGGKVPVGPVNTAKDIFEDPHPRARGMLVEVEQPGDNPPLVLAGCPIKLTGTPSGIYARAPRLGENTEQILAEAGIDVYKRQPPLIYAAALPFFKGGMRLADSLQFGLAMLFALGATAVFLIGRKLAFSRVASIGAAAA